MTVDHKKPLIKGGKTEKSNLQYLCKRCNGYKGGMSNRQFRNLMKAVQIILQEKEVNKNYETKNLA